MKTTTGIEISKRIVDPVHGEISLTQLELDIISTPEFQRLRHVSQLGLASLVFPGAVHNRFQHSLGAMQVMERLLSPLVEGSLLANGLAQELRLAALLHDIGHMPFSHVFEHQNDVPDHEHIGTKIIEVADHAKVIEDAGFSPRNVIGLLNQQPENPTGPTFLPLISSDIDADRMDYLLRDAYFSGVPAGKIDLERICSSITIHDDRVCFREKAQDALEGFLFGRWQMYKIVYIHKTVMQYDLLLRKMWSIMSEYRETLSLKFQLPRGEEISRSDDNTWFMNGHMYDTESMFFDNVKQLCNDPAVSVNDKASLISLNDRITRRCPIKNAVYFSALGEAGKQEFCEIEKKVFEELEHLNNVIDHWSFMRHDPERPLKIAAPVNADTFDDQDPKPVRVLVEKPWSGREVVYLQERPNSIMKKLADHHRALISYYHDEQDARKNIHDIAGKFLRL